MNYSRVIARVLCVVALSVVAVAYGQTKPSFTGSWKLNVRESKLESGEPLTFYKSFTQEIKHSEPKLHIVESIDDENGHRAVEWDLTTDGTEQATKVVDVPAKIAAKWDGSQLVASIIWNGDNTELKVVRRYKLSDDGKRITANFELFQGGTSAARATEIWDKQ